jgi:hypothetical protein
VGSAAGKVGDSIGTAAQKAKVPAIVGAVGAAGLAGGMALGSRMLGRRGGPLKSVAREVQHAGRELGKAGFRLGVGDVNMEVQKGRNSARRDSPLEVLIKGLTARR